MAEISIHQIIRVEEVIYISGLSMIYLTTESGSSVVEQWTGYPEVQGSIFIPHSDSTFQELSN